MAARQGGPGMAAREELDGFGVAALVGFSLLLGFNQVLIKFANEGLQPVFWAGIRSLGAAACVALWIWWSGGKFAIAPGTARAGLVTGMIFAFEFMLLFVALDLTTVVRVSVIFYSMPVWLALAAHLLIPGERLTPARSVGLLIAFSGVSWALISRSTGAEDGSLAGDLCALAASIGWAGIPLSTRITAMRRVEPEIQLMWHVSVSGPVLLVASLLFGPWIRDFEISHGLVVVFQSVVVVAGGFLGWLYLLKRYPTAKVASFSFLAPLFGAGFGWLLLGEPMTVDTWWSLVLVAVGLVLINRPQPMRR